MFYAFTRPVQSLHIHHFTNIIPAMEQGVLSEIPQPVAPPFDCRQALPPEVITGLELFNAGRYFEAHEELEMAWRREKGAIRDLYRGILQVGVGYYHIQRRNYRGALKMFLRCRQWLDLFPSECCGIDLARFRRDFEAIEAQVQRQDPAEPFTFSFQPIFYRIDPTETSTFEAK
jgi:predicted metal-dependent hydrolase